MNPRPFYRSRAFWSGLPGLVFLLWGWWMSTGHQSGMWPDGAGSWEVGQLAGEVYMFWESDEWPDWGNFHVSNVEIPLETARELKRKMVLWRGDDPTIRRVFIAYYWPVLAYVATWLLTLAWWQRRMARKMKLHSPP